VSKPKVEPETERSPGQKFALALDMFRYGCEMMRQNLRRAHPDADAAAIEELLRAWLRTRPGAEHGDGVGRPGTWPRTRGAGDG
jgi:Rv0078B-related antitoxin